MELVDNYVYGMNEVLKLTETANATISYIKDMKAELNSSTTADLPHL